MSFKNLERINIRPAKYQLSINQAIPFKAEETKGNTSLSIKIQ